MPTQRFFYKCNNPDCKQKRVAVDYEIVEENISPDFPSMTTFYKTPYGLKQIYEMPSVTCVCGWVATFPKMLKAKRGTHVCDSDCVSARGEECTCSCGGENHGSKYLLVLA